MGGLGVFIIHYIRHDHQIFSRYNFRPLSVLYVPKSSHFAKDADQVIVSSSLYANANAKLRPKSNFLFNIRLQNVFSIPTYCFNKCESTYSTSQLSWCWSREPIGGDPVSGMLFGLSSLHLRDGDSRAFPPPSTKSRSHGSESRISPLRSLLLL